MIPPLPTTPEELEELLDKLPFTIPENTRIAWHPEMLTDDAQLQPLLRSLCNWCAAWYKEKLGFPCAMIVFSSVDHENNPARMLAASVLKDESIRSKNFFAAAMRRFAADVQAPGIFHVAEVWHYNGTDLEAFEAHKKANGGSYEGFPGVTELLSISLETRFSYRQWHCPIVRDSAAVSLGEWVASEPVSLDKVSGRFTHLLDPKPSDGFKI